MPHTTVVPTAPSAHASPRDARLSPSRYSNAQAVGDFGFLLNNPNWRSDAAKFSHSRLIEVLGVALKAKETCNCSLSPNSLRRYKTASSSGMSNAGDREEGRDADEDDDDDGPGNSDHPLMIARRVLSAASDGDGGRNSPSTIVADRFARFAVPPSQSGSVGVGHCSTVFPARLPNPPSTTTLGTTLVSIGNSPPTVNSCSHSANLLPFVSPRVTPGAATDLQPVLRMPSLPTYPQAPSPSVVRTLSNCTSPRSAVFLNQKTSIKSDEPLAEVYDLPNGAVDSVPEGASGQLVHVPLRLLCFYQDYVCNRFIDGRSLKDTIAELREGMGPQHQDPNRTDDSRGRPICLPPSIQSAPIASNFSLPLLSVFTPTGSSSSNPQVPATAVKPQTPDTLPIMDAMFWRGRWFGMGNRRLTCFHYLFAKAPNTLIPVMATHVKDSDSLMPQGTGYNVKIGGGLFIDGQCLLTLNHCCKPQL